MLRQLLLLAFLVSSSSAVLELTGGSWVYADLDPSDIQVTFDKILQKKAQHSKHFDGKVFMELVEMAPYALTKVQDYYKKDEAGRQKEDRLLHSFSLKCFEFFCKTFRCKSGGKCNHREASKALADHEVEMMVNHLEGLIKHPFTTESDPELLGRMHTLVDIYWKNKDAGFNDFLMTGKLPEEIYSSIAFHEDPEKHKKLEAMVHRVRHVAWRALIRKSILALDEIAHVADKADEILDILKNYVECECILGFVGEHCETCTIGDNIMRKIRKPSFESKHL